MTEELKNATDWMLSHYALAGRPIAFRDAGLNYQEKLVAAMHEVCIAYLSGHPSDEELPADSDWLRTRGKEVLTYADCYLRFEFKKVGQNAKIVAEIDLPTGKQDWYVQNVNTSAIPTPVNRGEVRRLCAAVGISLNGETHR